MYYTTRTESDQENLNPNQHTATQRVLASDIALSKALENISQLQENLHFMLELNSKIQSENTQLKAINERNTEIIKNQQQKDHNKLQDLHERNEELEEVLSQAKDTLLQTEADLNDCKKEIEQYQRIIYEKNKAYEELENYMNQNNSMAYIGDTSSLNCGRSDLHYISELEREKIEHEIIIKKLEQKADKNENKIQKLEKECGDFKKWMASILGLHRVVEGSEKILMDEIAQRMNAIS